jgi:hypothetical protein
VSPVWPFHPCLPFLLACQINMDEKGVKPGSEEDRWDEHHNDPQADVVLVSEDDVSFRVNSWYIKQKR